MAGDVRPGSKTDNGRPGSRAGDVGPGSRAVDVKPGSKTDNVRPESRAGDVIWTLIRCCTVNFENMFEFYFLVIFSKY